MSLPFQARSIRHNRRAAYKPLKQGAKLVETVQDILDELGWQPSVVPAVANEVSPQEACWIRFSITSVLIPAVLICWPHGPGCRSKRFLLDSCNWNLKASLPTCRAVRAAAESALKATLRGTKPRNCLPSVTIRFYHAQQIRPHGNAIFIFYFFRTPRLHEQKADHCRKTFRGE